MSTDLSSTLSPLSPAQITEMALVSNTRRHGHVDSPSAPLSQALHSSRNLWDTNLSLGDLCSQGSPAWSWTLGRLLDPLKGSGMNGVVLGPQHEGGGSHRCGQLHLGLRPPPLGPGDLRQLPHL